MNSEQSRRAGQLAMALGLVVAVTAAARGELNVSAKLMGIHQDSPYAYARISVQNRDAFELTYRLTIRSYYPDQRTAVRDQRLGPGETRTHHVAFVAFTWGSGQVEVVDSLGRQVTTGLNSEELRYLHISPVRGWITPAELQDFATLYASTSPGGYTSYGYSSSSGELVSQAEPTELPDNWLCFAPFRVVLIPEQSWQQLPPVERQALQQWVQAGGHLAIYGASEERTVPTMLGTIEYLATATNPIKDQVEKKTLEARWLLPSRVWQIAPSVAPGTTLMPFRIQKWTGRLGGFVLATLFFIVAGPVNYWYFARRGRLRLLLVSLPVASLACCLLITAYFLASQGFAKRGGSLAVILVDEETDSAVTLSQHVFFSGLYPLGGFFFAHDTAFCPLSSTARETSFTMDLTEGQRLRSGFFTPSTNFHYVTVRPWTTRAKLVFDLDAMTVINGFDADAVRVAIEVGDKLYTAQDVPQGGKAALSPAVRPTTGVAALSDLVLDRSDPADGFVLQHMAGVLNTFAGDATTGRYLVVFATPPVDVNAGLTIGGGHTRCVLAGRSLVNHAAEPATSAGVGDSP